MSTMFELVVGASAFLVAAFVLLTDFETSESYTKRIALMQRQTEALERIADSLEGGCEDAGSGPLPEGVGFGPALEGSRWSPWARDDSLPPLEAVIELPIGTIIETKEPFGTIITLPYESELLQRWAGEGMFTGPAR